MASLRSHCCNLVEDQVCVATRDKREQGSKADRKIGRERERETEREREREDRVKDAWTLVISRRKASSMHVRSLGTHGPTRGPVWTFIFCTTATFWTQASFSFTFANLRLASLLLHSSFSCLWWWCLLFVLAAVLIWLCSCPLAFERFGRTLKVRSGGGANLWCCL